MLDWITNEVKVDLAIIISLIVIAFNLYDWFRKK